MLEREMERKKIKVDAAHFVLAAVVGGLVRRRRACARRDIVWHDLHVPPFSRSSAKSR